METLLCFEEIKASHVKVWQFFQLCFSVTAVVWLGVGKKKKRFLLKLLLSVSAAPWSNPLVLGRMHQTQLTCTIIGVRALGSPLKSSGSFFLLCN